MLDIVENEFTVTTSDDVHVIHDADINFVNSSISVATGSSILISTPGHISLDIDSFLSAPMGEISFFGGSIEIFGGIDTGIGNLMTDASRGDAGGIILIGSGVTLTSDSSISLNDGGRIVLSPIDSGIIVDDSINSGGPLVISAAAVPLPPAVLLFASVLLIFGSRFRNTRFQNRYPIFS